MLNATVSTLNLMATADATVRTLNVGADDATVRTMNLRAGLNVGTATNLRTVNLYGTTNFMGSTGTGFRIDWNGTDNSLDFIKN